MLTEKLSEWQNIVPTLQAGDLILIHGASPLARAVRTRTRSYWSHIVMVLDPIAANGTTTVIDASERGVHIGTLEQYASHPEKYDIGVKRFPELTMPEKEHIISFARATVGARYDYLRVIGFLIDPLVEFVLPRRVWLWIWEHVYIGKGRYVCSTLVQKAFLHGLLPERLETAHARPKIFGAIDVECTSAGDFARSAGYHWVFNPHM